MFLRSNAVLHELTHLLNDKGNHCKANSPTCVWRAAKNSYFYGRMTNNYTIYGWSVSLSWHTLDEVNEMRQPLGLKKHRP